MQHTVQTIGLTENYGVCNTIRFFQMGFNVENKLELDNFRHNVYLSVRKLGVALLDSDPTGSGIVPLPTLLDKVLEKFKFNEYFIEFKIFEIFLKSLFYVSQLSIFL